MRVAAVSTSGQQLVVNNVAPNCGFEYFDDINYVGIAEYNPHAIYFGGWFVQEYSDLSLYLSLMGDIPKVIVHWFGSDVFICRNWRAMGEEHMFDMLRTDRFVHIPPSQKIKEEIENWLELPTVEPLNTPAEELLSPMPKPENFTVGCYMPPGRQEFFRLPLIGQSVPQLRVGKRYADIVFYHWLPPIQPITYPGPCQKRYALNRDEYKNVLKDTSCLLRIPMHDAYSISAAEYLMSGRPVVSDQDLPKWPAWIRGRKKDGRFDAKSIIMALKKAASDGEVPESVQEFYRDMYDPSKFKKRLEERCRERWPEFSFDA